MPRAGQFCQRFLCIGLQLRMTCAGQAVAGDKYVIMTVQPHHRQVGAGGLTHDALAPAADDRIADLFCAGKADFNAAISGFRFALLDKDAAARGVIAFGHKQKLGPLFQPPERFII